MAEALGGEKMTGTGESEHREPLGKEEVTTHSGIKTKKKVQ